jgi:hypothetical protein
MTKKSMKNFGRGQVVNKTRDRQFRKPLTNEQIEYLKELYYKEHNFFGRDRLYEKIKADKQHISRRQLYVWLDAQDIHQKFSRVFRPRVIKSTILSKPNVQVGIDLIDMSRVAYNGFKWILTCIDLYSKKGYAIAIKSKEASDVANGFKEILNQIGHPISAVRSDNGSEFKSELTELLKSKGIKQIFSLPYTPQSNGQVERFNQTLKRQLRMILISQGTKDWNTYIQQVCDNYNNSVQNTTKRTPDSITEAEPAVKENITKSVLKNKKLVNPTMKVGDKVRIVEQDEDTGVNWSKAIYTIVQVNKPKSNISYPTYKIDKPNNKKMFYQNDLLLVNEVHNELPEQKDVLKVKRILEPKLTHGEPSYLVKWEKRKTPEITLRENLKEDVPKLLERFEKANKVIWNKNKKNEWEFSWNSKKGVEKSQETFYVEKILKPLIINNEPCYLIKWRGYDEPETTTRATLLEDVPEILEKFDKINKVEWIKTRGKLRLTFKDSNKTKH